MAKNLKDCNLTTKECVSSADFFIYQLVVCQILSHIYIHMYICIYVDTDIFLHNFIL